MIYSFSIVSQKDIEGLLDSDLEDEPSNTSGKKKKNIRNAFKQAQARVKTENKEELNQILDEYYKLDYEDLVSNSILGILLQHYNKFEQICPRSI